VAGNPKFIAGLGFACPGLSGQDRERATFRLWGIQTISTMFAGFSYLLVVLGVVTIWFIWWFPAFDHVGAYSASTVLARES